MKKFIVLIAAILLGSATFAQTKEAVHIYNPKANAQAVIDAAVAKAKKEGKHVFIQVGGNWCVWCIRFHDLVANTPDLKKFLSDHYEVVLLNYSPENKNEAVLKKLSNPDRFGFPVFLILGQNGKLIHTQDSGYLEEGGGHSVKKVMAFLKNWTVAALNPPSN